MMGIYVFLISFFFATNGFSARIGLLLIMLGLSTPSDLENLASKARYLS